MVYAAPRRKEFHELLPLEKFNMFMIAVISLCLATAITVPIRVLADESLTSILGSRAFQGSMEVVNKFNWIGWLMNTIISVFSIIGLFMIIYQRLITLLYLAGKQYWDNVYDLKTEAAADSWFGFPGMAKDIYTGKRGMGFDSIIGFLYMLSPNVKSYSDYNPARPLQGLNEETDTVLTYFLHTLPMTVLLGFFFTIGFSGTLTKGYAMLIDGLAAAADKAVTLNFEGWVKKTLNTGGGHQFTLGADDSATGKFGEKIARDLYSRVIARLDVVNEDAKLHIGRNCEEWVIENILGGSTEAGARIDCIDAIAQTAVVENATETLTTRIRTDDDVKTAQYTIRLNTSETLAGGVGVSVPLTELTAGLDSWESDSVAEEYYFHIMITKGKINTANYFAPADSGTSGTGGGNTNTGGNNNPGGAPSANE